MPESDLRSLLIWHQESLSKIQQLEKQVSQAWKEFRKLNGHCDSIIIRLLTDLHVPDSLIVKNLITKGEYRCSRLCSFSRKTPLCFAPNKNTTLIEAEVVRKKSSNSKMMHEEIIIKLLPHPTNDPKT